MSEKKFLVFRNGLLLASTTKTLDEITRFLNSSNRDEGFPQGYQVFELTERPIKKAGYTI